MVMENKYIHGTLSKLNKHTRQDVVESECSGNFVRKNTFR